MLYLTLYTNINFLQIQTAARHIAKFAGCGMLLMSKKSQQQQ